MLARFISVFSKNFRGTSLQYRRWYRKTATSRFQIHCYWKEKFYIPFQKLTKLDFHWSRSLEQFDLDSCQKQYQMNCCPYRKQCILWPHTRFRLVDFVEQSRKSIKQWKDENGGGLHLIMMIGTWQVTLRATWRVTSKSIRIPTVKLKIPGKSMGKSGYRTSVTFKLKFFTLVQIHYWCTALMWKIGKMPIADWLPCPPTLYINIGFGLSYLPVAAVGT